MKAMLLDRPAPIEQKPLRRADIPLPEPGTGEILIKVGACGVCHTDLHTAEGDLPLPVLPMVPGHQIVGRVEKAGPNTHRFWIQDRVGVTWFFAGCGSCNFCAQERENLCSKALFTGYHVNGGYAEYMVVPEESAFLISELFSDAHATPLLCGGVIGYRALRLSEIKPGQRLGLYGFGNSAHVVIQVAVKMDCRVHVFTRSLRHQKLAEELGPRGLGQPRRPLSNLLTPRSFLRPRARLSLKHCERLTREAPWLWPGSQ